MPTAEQEKARESFAALVVGDGDPPLDLACALIAAEEQRGVDPGRILVRLDVIAESIHIPEGIQLFEAVARLNHHLFQKMGFQGDAEDYDNPRNSFLDQVLDRRRGLPILLGVVYIELARRAGLSVDGVGFPGHFLVSPSPGEAERFYVDPFHSGEILTRARLSSRLEKMGLRDESLLEPVGSRYILVRLHNNLKHAYLRRSDLAGALRAVERLLLLSPDNRDEARDRDRLLALLNNN